MRSVPAKRHMKFVKGMDLSTLLELERCGAKYYDNGEERDLLAIMKSYDVDTIRIRLWNDPWSETGESYGAGENDLKTSLEIAKRVTAAGFGVLLNFHYSDFWADPGKQIKPKAWADYGVKELEQAVYDYTLESMQTFLDAGVNITMVQVGNELSNGLLWPEGKVPNYDNIATFVNAGIRAVRKADAAIPVMIHLDNGGNNALYREWFDNFTKRGEDFEIIGLSYYPFWHGSLQMLNDNMNDIAERYGKDLVIAEVSMGYTMEDYKNYEKLSDEERKGYDRISDDKAGAVRFHGGFLEPHQPHQRRKRKGILLLGAGMDSGTGLRLGNTGILKIHERSGTMWKRVGKSGAV